MATRARTTSVARTLFLPAFVFFALGCGSGSSRSTGSDGAVAGDLGGPELCRDGRCLGPVMQRDASTASSQDSGADLAGDGGSGLATIPSGFFGHHMISAGHWPTTSFGLFRTWDSYHVSWAWVETSAGNYDWSNLDPLVEQATASGKDIVYTFGLTPAWATGGACSNQEGCAQPPVNLQDWKDFVTAIVTRYHDRIKYWELWNEANNTQFWVGTVPQLVTQSQAAYTIMKSIDPTLTVISPSSTGGAGAIGSFLASYLAAGGGTDADAVAFHGYPSDCCTANSQPQPEEVNGIITAVKSAMSAHGQAGKPLWDTEGGWGENVTTPSVSNQAAFLARHYLLQWSGGVSRFSWYAWDNASWGELWSSGSGINAAGTAYAQVYDWMVGASMEGPCAVVSGTVWSCTLARTGGYQALAVWNTAGPSSYTPASAYTKVRSLAGTTTTIAPGSATMIGIQPLLFENQ
jgi:polysaccharide biosynthesis protein PslG